MISDTIITPLYSVEKDTAIDFLAGKYDDLKRGTDFWKLRTSFWWEKNPYFNNKMPIGWAIKSVEGTIQGFIGCVFTAMAFGQNHLCAVNLTCWHVEDGYRNKSLELFVAANSYENGDIFFNTTPTESVEKILKGFRYTKYIPSGIELYTNLLPLNIGSFNVFVNKPAINRFLSPFLSLASYANSFLFLKLFSNKKYHIEFGLPEDLNKLDQLWEKSKPDSLVTNLRDALYYQWLSSGKFANKYTILRINENATTIATVVFEKISIAGNNILECIDFWQDVTTDAEKSLTLNKCMIGFLVRNRMKFQNVAFLSFPDYCGSIPKQVFSMRKFRSRNNKYCLALAPEVREAIKSNNIYFTMQGDMNL